MQATLSRTASGMWRHDEPSVAPLTIDINRYRDGDVTPRRRMTDLSDEGGPGGLSAEAGELLSVLQLSATMLGQPGICEGDLSSLQVELDELVERSWKLLEHLVESKAKGEPSDLTFAKPVFLRGQRLDGAPKAETGQPDPAARRGLLTEVHAEAGGEERGVVLEETATGWIAC